MICISPEVSLPNEELGDDPSANVSTGFIMDNVEALRDWCSVDRDDCTPFEYFQNPVYYPFTDRNAYNFEDGIGMREGDIMVINAS